MSMLLKDEYLEIKEATGKDIGRCYYCDFCLGWHITSASESSKHFRKMD